MKRDPRGAGIIAFYPQSMSTKVTKKQLEMICCMEIVFDSGETGCYTLIQY
jgi:hypothetical protein